jgi:hypothetical protein
VQQRNVITSLAALASLLVTMITSLAALAALASLLVTMAQVNLQQLIKSLFLVRIQGV